MTEGGNFETDNREMATAWCSAGAVFRTLPHSSFGIASDFDIRVSDFAHYNRVGISKLEMRNSKQIRMTEGGKLETGDRETATALSTVAVF
jgi:hypothetical protein